MRTKHDILRAQRTYKMMKRGTTNLRLLDEIDDTFKDLVALFNVYNPRKEVIKFRRDWAKNAGSLKYGVSMTKKAIRRSIDYLRKVLKASAAILSQASGYKQFERVLQRIIDQTKRGIESLAWFMQRLDVYVENAPQV
jgi:Mg2+ and Co2+ transporter CorA